MTTYHPNAPRRERLHLSTVNDAYRLVERLVALRRMENAIEASAPATKAHVSMAGQGEQRSPSYEQNIMEAFYRGGFGLHSAPSRSDLELDLDARLLLPAINAAILAIEAQLQQMGIEV